MKALDVLFFGALAATFLAVPVSIVACVTFIRSRDVARLPPRSVAAFLARTMALTAVHCGCGLRHRDRRKHHRKE
jgi:hypothetical protein